MKFLLDSSLRNNLIDEVEKNGFEHLPISAHHVMELEELPFLHKDPFDRMLIAQAQKEQFTLMTADRQILQYRLPLLFAC